MYALSPLMRATYSADLTRINKSNRVTMKILHRVIYFSGQFVGSFLHCKTGQSCLRPTVFPGFIIFIDICYDSLDEGSALYKACTYIGQHKRRINRRNIFMGEVGFEHTIPVLEWQITVQNEYRTVNAA
jgi:hypothetical protein